MNNDLSKTKEMKMFKKIGVCLLIITLILYLFLVIELFKN
jgi:hypothetical protein